MPKKKKKSRDSGGGSGAITSPTTTKTTSAVNEPLALVDLISLQVVKSSTPPTKTLKHSPTILLNKNDADQLGVVTGDEMFLLMASSTSSSSEDEKLQISKSAIATAHVHSNSTTIGSPSNYTPKKTPVKSPLGSLHNQRSKLTPGNCHVFPVALATFLFGGEGEKDPNVVTTPITTAPKTPTSSSQQFQNNNKAGSTPSSSSKSKFSFAPGGGGDKLISTPTKKTPPSTPSKNTKPPRRTLMAIPVESDLGDAIGNLLCRHQTADTIHVKEEEKEDDDDDDEANNNNNSNSNKTKKLVVGPLCERLVLAHTVGSYVSKGTLFSMSFRGQVLSCQISNLTSKMMTKDLTKSFSKLSLLEETQQKSLPEEHMAVLTAIKQQYNEKKKNNYENLLLYKIDNNTSIRIGGDGDDDTDNNLQVNKENHATTNKLVAGLETTVTEVESWFTTTFQHAKLCQQGLLRPPKGLLLHGPSGTGKSALALQIVRNLESNVHVEHVHCTALQSQTAMVGQAERRLVEIFQSAKRRRQGKVGSLIILDDVHLICPRRQGVNLGADRLSATLLALLDGVESDNNTDNEASGMVASGMYPVVILAITTNPSTLDPALRRPGRLDSEVEVPVPVDPNTRNEILQFQLENLSARANLSSTEWLGLARQAKGFTGADLKLAAKEAIRNAASRLDATTTDTTTSVNNGPILVTKQQLVHAIRATKPSAIKAVTVEIPQVHWSSIGGMEDAKRELREAIELPLTHGQMFTELGIQPPRGVLLYGPPGCSKTLMARALATEGHMNFLAVKGPELLSKWLGESERTLASLFKRARLASPSVIFFDEVDAIASKRSGNSSGGERLLSQMLTELDGIQKGGDGDTNGQRRVVVVCATNRPDLLDNALMRPGRIDRMIYVGVPDAKSRHRILEISLKGKSCAVDIDISHLAGENVSGGLSGAEMVAACRNAALMALEEDNKLEGFSSGPTIKMTHLEDALANSERQITKEMLDFYASFQGRREQ